MKLLISLKLVAVVGVRTSDVTNSTIGCTELVRTVVAAVRKRGRKRKRERVKLLIAFRGA